MNAALLEACLATGCHYADIADDRGYCKLVRSHDDRFRRQRLAAVYGCSSLPTISGALALHAGAGVAAAPRRARVTLLIGNDNPKGSAAVASLVGGLGKAIGAPQGIIKGFRDREVVPLPEPFGPRAAFNFDSPEYDLFPALLGVSAVSVKVAFDVRTVNYGFALLAALSSSYGRRFARSLGTVSKGLRFAGTSGAVVAAELFYANGSVRRAAMVARTDGQRMAALPCVEVVQTLCGGIDGPRGARTGYELVGAEALLAHLVEGGFELDSGF